MGKKDKIYLKYKHGKSIILAAKIKGKSKLNKKWKNSEVWLHWKEIYTCTKAEEISQAYYFRKQRIQPS